MLLPDGNFIGNRTGVVFTNATQTDAGSSTASAVYMLPNHTFRCLGGIGMIVCDLDKSASSDATDVVFEVNGINISVTDAANEAIDITDITAGLHILIFNKFTNRIQFII